MNTLAKPHAPNPARISAEGEKKIEELIEQDKQIIEDASKAVEEEFKELKNNGEINFEELKQQAKDFVEQAKKYVDETYVEASNRVHQMLEENENDPENSEEPEDSEEPEEELIPPHNFKGKHSKGERFHAAKLSDFRAHGIRPHARVPCGNKKIAQLKSEEEEAGALDQVKEFSQNLYEDVSNIDFKESFYGITEDEGALCAIAGGLLGGVTFLAVAGGVAQVIKRAKRANKVQLPEDDEEATVLTEKQ